MPTQYRSLLLVTAAFLSLLFTSCNVFEAFDSPGDDEQILSEARACFDQGDIACAKKMYGKLSSAKADVAGSELAFALLDNAGVTMSVFMTAIPAGQGGKGVTKMAELIAPGSKSKRQTIFEAYKASTTIVSKELRGLIRFLASFALVAEILAEQIGSDGSLYKNSIVREASSCIADSAAATLGCLGSPACSAASTSTLGPGATVDFTGSLAGIDLSTGDPTLGMIVGAMNAVNYAFQQELNASGKFNTGTGGFVRSILGSDPVLQAPCIRYALISNDVGS